jgi:hypothetical protein
MALSRLGLAAVLACAAPRLAAAESAPRGANQCFFINQLQGWRAANDQTVYIRVGLRDIYRLDMAGACPELTAPDARLITKTRGPDTVCSAVDWDLSVSEPGPGAIPVPCIVSSMRKLKAAEAAALPKKLRP